MYAKSLSECKLCHAGMFCGEAQRNEGTICPEGYVCPRGSIANQWPCPKGTYGGYMEGKKSLDECAVCPPGHVCGEACTAPE
jgi:hypothetical protein